MEKKNKKIGIVCINLNPPYWQFANEMLWGLNTFFLKHPSIKDKYDIQLMLWSDLPEDKREISLQLAEYMTHQGDVQTSVINETEKQFIVKEDKKAYVDKIIQDAQSIRERGVKIFYAESIEWPMPTLMRYHLFLQQEEYLEQFDYIFYIDVDMKITDWIGEEILGDGLTAAQHPMHALKKELWPPYEPNEKSTAYIKRPGKVIDDGGKPRFMPTYYAGGFQGGKTEDFIKAMKAMRKNIDDDHVQNYIAIWNDESHFNRYLFDNPPSVILNPSYIYPDSLISEYYVPIWGRNYSPKIMTLTKSFTTTSQGGQEVRKMIDAM